MSNADKPLTAEEMLAAIHELQADDLRVLEQVLDDLRALDRHVLALVACEMTMAAARAGDQPKGKVLLLLGRIAYVLAREWKSHGHG